MKRVSLILATATSVAALLAASSASAQVANTSQKGSLLVFPLINVDQKHGNSGDTFIEVSNDASASIHVECEYINEQKGRTNFDFELTGKQTASWDVLTLDGDHANPPPFPLQAGNPPYPGNRYRGELICFATNDARKAQVSWNELTGTATVLELNDTGAGQPRHAFKYNAWAFCAESAVGVCDPSDNNVNNFGAPGTLLLTDGGAGTYNACPAKNIANFMPNGAKLGNLTTLDNDLAVVSCNQDLREQYTIHRTKLDFTVWNANESSFTGAYDCVDSVNEVQLGVSKGMVDGSNFDETTLKTPNARFQVFGNATSGVCSAPTEYAGLLGVIHSSTAIGADTTEDQEIGNTTQGVGSETGYVLWDVAVPHRR